MPNKIIVAHRGAPRLARENTIESFKKALELGAKVIEFDVRQTGDKVLAVIHDDNIGGKKIADSGFIALNKLAAGRSFQIPTLEEVLSFLAGKARLQIEIKARGYETAAAETALKLLKPEDFVIISFDLAILKIIKQKYPQVRTALIIGTRYGRITQIILFAAKRAGILPFVDEFSINWKIWISGFAKLVPEKYPITVWTANETNLIKSIIRDGRVRFIASDVPELAIKLLEYGNSQ